MGKAAKRKASLTSRRNSKYIYRFLCFWIPYIKDHLLPTNSLLGYGNLSMSVLLYSAIYVIVGAWLNAFKIGVERKANILANQVLTLFTTDFIGTFVSSAISGDFRYYFDLVRMYVIVFLLQALFNCLISIPMTDIYRFFFPPLKLLEIYGNYENDSRKSIGRC